MIAMWARVSGPGITGVWGCDSITIESTGDVIFDPNGTLTIKSPGGIAPNGRAYSAGTTTYAKGSWTKVRTSEHVPRA